MVKLTCIPVRALIAVMIFFTTFTNYMMRSNMSVSIIEMVKYRNKSKHIAPCLIERGENTSEETKNQSESTSIKYQWSESVQGYILAGYFWGYFVLILPAGIISEIAGPWNAILWSSLISAVLTALLPMTATPNGGGVIAVRILIGACGALAYPAGNVLVARWAPPVEKGKFVSALLGNTLGTVVTMPLVGIMTDEFGWEWGFYVLVIIMGVFCIVFGALVRDYPANHPCISNAEKTYILESQEGHVTAEKVVPPYKSIITSVPFWALCSAQFGNLWGLNLIMTFSPKYLKETLGFNIKKSAALSGSPYLARLIASQIFGIIGDKIRKKNLMSVTKLRKSCIIFSHFIPAALLYCITAAGCESSAVVAILILCQVFNGAIVIGHLGNAQDLAPNFVGTIYAAINFVGGITGFVVPIISAKFMDYYNKETTAAAYIFSIGASVYACGGLIFVIFGSGDIQPWNEKRQDAQRTNEE